MMSLSTGGAGKVKKSKGMMSANILALKKFEFINSASLKGVVKGLDDFRGIFSKF